MCPGRTRLPALGGRVHNEGLVGDRAHLDRLFEESPEEEAAELGAVPVEPKRELVEVRLEVVPRHGSLVRTQQPSLHETRNTVYSRQDHMGLDAGAATGKGRCT